MDTERYVLKAFAPDNQSRALELLRAARLHDGSTASPRLLRCALLASQGNLETLTSMVEQLLYDYRDVILAGEYVRTKGEWIQVRDLNEPIEGHS
jgi:hypothetical protein